MGDLSIDPLEREAQDYYLGFNLTGHFGKPATAVACYIAGHQSAERKSAAHIEHLQKLCRELVGDPAGYDDKLIEETKAELHKAREMVRELVGALEECLGPLDLDLTCAHCGLRDAHTTDCPDTLAEGVLRKFKDEIDQLGREQNGASSTKVMGEME